MDEGSPEPRALVQLERCHRRLEEAVAALRKAAEEHDLECAADVSAFFGRQIRRHEEDEEQSLFPRLLTLSAVDTSDRLQACIERLREEHRRHEALQQQLEDVISGRATESTSPGVDRWTALARLADELAHAYGPHIEEEEATLFPAARTTLTQRDFDAIAGEMDARRGRS